MSKPVYFAWANRFPAKVDPEVAYDELERIRESVGGEMTADDVVKASKAKRSVLHKQFEWDDAECGLLWRRKQAQVMMASLHVKYEDAEHIETRAYVAVHSQWVDDDDQELRSFVTTSEALADPVYRDEILSEALKSLKSWRKKYAELGELAGVFSIIDKMIKRA